MKLTKSLGVFFGIFLATTIAIAGFNGFNGSSSLGLFTTLKCSTGVTCTKNGGVMTLTAAVPDLTLDSDEVISNSVDDIVDIASNDSDITLSLTSPLTSNGDATLMLIADNSADNGDDWQVQHDGATNDLIFQNNKTGSQATYFTLTEDGDAKLFGTTPYLTLGDADAEDSGLLFDGNAQDFNISLDDSIDSLVIGLGSAAGTTDAIRIDANQDVTFVQNVRGLGTDSLSGFKQTQTAATATTITAAQCGSTFYNSGAIEIELPEVSTVAGCRLTFIVMNAAAFTIDPDGGDQIVLITNAAGDAMSADAVGESITIEAMGTGTWAPVGAQQGTWSDAN